MRHYLYLLFIVLTAISLISLVGCEGDDGKDGEDADFSKCFGTCHSDDYSASDFIVPFVTQYEESTHGTGETFERNSADCSICHTNEGFQEVIASGEAISPSNPSRIGCFTCHEPHTNEDFSLRTADAVALMMGDATYDYGDSNLCANCHQARTTEWPTEATFEITSSRYGPHHGPQANMLAGAGGYEFAGENYPNSFHTTAMADADGCVGCHMAAPYGNQAGGHTWALKYLYHGNEEELVAGCNVDDCHGEGGFESFDDRDTQTDMAAKLAELKTLLLNLGAITDSDSVVTGTYPAAVAGAVYNYNFVREDYSLGIHNTRYAKALLDTSIDALEALP